MHHRSERNGAGVDPGRWWLPLVVALALLATGVASSAPAVSAAPSAPPVDAVCGPDGYEPNDTSVAAVEVVEFVPYSATSCGDDDWFVMQDVRPGVQVGVDLYFTHGDGDLDLQLFDPAAGGGPVVHEFSSTDDESARYTVPFGEPAGRPVYIRVFGATVDNGSGPEIAQNSYGMAVYNIRCPPDDPREEDDTFGTATPVATDADLQGIACDDDLVSVPLQRGDRLTATLTVPDAFSARALHLYDAPSDGSGIASRTANQKVQVIDTVILATGTYYVEVAKRFSDETGGVPYDLTLEVARPCASGFTDVGTAHQFCPEIAFVATAGYIDGYADGTYDPTRVVSRQALAKMLYGYFGADFTPPVVATFSDVPVGAPFRTEIEWLVDQGYATGFGDGTFGPTAPVSRQAFAAMVSFRCGGEPPPVAPPAFSDVPPTSPFVDAIACMVATGLTSGYADGTFRPTLPITRQTAAAYLARMSVNS